MKLNHPVTDREVLMKDGTILVTRTDLKGRITYTNEAFVDISGFSEAELLGANHNVVRHPDMPPEAFADLWNTLKSGQPWRGLVKNRCKNGDYYWVEANVTPVHENGQLQGYLSARYAPSREQIRNAETLYELIKNKKASIRPQSWLDKLNFVKRLGVGAKLTFIAVLLIIPSLLLIGMLVHEKNNTIEFAEKELKGLEYVTPLFQLLSSVNTHRSLLAKDKVQSSSELLQIRKAITDHLNALNTLDSVYGTEFGTTESFLKIKQDWTRIESLSATDNVYKDHKALMKRIGSLIIDVADQSNLTLDPDVDSYYAMSLVTLRMPQLLDHLGELKALLERQPTDSSLEQIKGQVAVLDVQIDSQLEGIKHDLFAIYKANEDLKSVLADKEQRLYKELDKFRTGVAQKTSQSEYSSLVDEPLSNSAISALESVSDLFKTNNNLLKSLLEKRIAGFEQSKYSQLAVVLTVILLVSTLGFFIIRYIVNSLKGINNVFSQIGEGHFRNALNLDGCDELGDLLRGLQSMQVNLNVNISNTREQVIKSTRVEKALDNVNSSVMLANNNFEIIYMNKAVEAMFKNAEADIRKQLPDFDANKILGANIDIFHKNPAHQRSMLTQLESTHKSEITIGGRYLTVIANPVKDAEGIRIGTVVEWSDRTQEVKIEQEIAEIVEQVKAGELSSRIAMTGKVGFFATLSAGINELTDVIEQAFGDVARVMQALSGGDLTQRITTDYQGVYAQCKSDINETVDKLSEIVSHIRSSADFISNTSHEIASGNNNLSQRVETQASSLEETASSMEQLTGTVKNNAENSQQANQVANNARQLAEKGGNVVASAVSAMAEINESSNKIAEIIGVIDEIAFQTNLLALNASVEAARAGEHGRGFSVVATEVRNLAQRSAVAAKESKELIQSSVQKVRSGTEFVNETGTALQEIVTSVKRVGDIISEIASASIEQAQGIQQVNQAVSQMDEITQQNAALAEEASAASVSMSDQATTMADLLNFFKLDNHTPSRGDKPAVANSLPRQNKPGVSSTPLTSGPLSSYSSGLDKDGWEDF
jgi:methyl-accepting chemotaxis protein